jgi:hypothetical protein
VADSAKAIINDFLRQFQLEALGTWAWGKYVENGGGELGIAAVQSEVYDTPEFQVRFPAYRALAQKGRAMTAAEMLAYERTATQLLRAAGLPAGFYDSPQDFAGFLQNEVSVAELQQRVQIAQNATLEAPESVKAALRDDYGLDEGDLAAHFLDPAKAMPLLQQKYAAAQISGKARSIGIGVTAGMSEDLVKSGVTLEQAGSTLQSVADSQGLFQNSVSEEGAFSADEQVGAAFGTNQAARDRVRKRTQERKAAFGGSSGYSTGNDGVTALTPVR